MRLKWAEMWRRKTVSQISVTRSIPASEFIVAGGDLNGHVGSDDAVHGGYGFGERNADSEQLVEFCDAVELIVANTCFKRQNNKLATYVSSSIMNTIDYLLMRPTNYKTRSSADADNRLDAFSGQSRSTNMVPFHM